MEDKKRYEFIGKWVGYLFIITIINIVANLMTNETAAKILPILYTPGQILNIICTLGYSFVLIKLGVEEDRYKTSGMLSLVTSGLSVLALLFSNAVSLILIIAIISLVISLVAEYNEFTAHSIIFSGLDYEMSTAWSDLWKWNMGVLIAMLACLGVTVIIPVIGAILLLIVTIITLGISIAKIYYLHKTSKFFKGYSGNQNV